MLAKRSCAFCLYLGVRATNDLMRKMLPIVALLMVLPSVTARAELTICNEYDQKVFVAAGSQQSNTVRTMGWWEVAPGQCRIINAGKVMIPTYVHVETEKMPARAGSFMQYMWGEGRKLVVGTTKFQRENAHQPQPGDLLAEFADVTKGLVGNFAGVTYYVRDSGGEARYACPSGQRPVRYRSSNDVENFGCEK
jgi:uncharacterized membrane protein